jgi:ribosomal protein L11 methyltransferase
MSEQISRRETYLVRLAIDEASAKRAANLIAEMFEPETAAAAAFETDNGWNFEVHFANEPDYAYVVDLLRVVAGEQAQQAMFETVAQKDWVAASLEGLKPVRVGRFVVHGAHDREKIGANQIGIEIEAALAFGTGHHGTTQGCLAAIERIIRSRHPRRILDLGTGTGVLAIAAARSMRHPVIASDFDMVAVTTARENVRLNRVSGFVNLLCATGVNAPAIRIGAPYDLVLANILLPTLKQLARPVRPLLASNAIVVLSGLLTSQANAALSVWLTQGLRLLSRQTIEGWTTLTLQVGRV